MCACLIGPNATVSKFFEVCKTGEVCHHEGYDTSHPPKAHSIEHSRSPEMAHPVDQWFLNLFGLSTPLKKNQAKYPLTTQLNFALKYSEMIRSPEAGETV